MSKVPKLGDYVLATKYSDGDPLDQWAIGFYAGPVREDRHMVTDREGRPFRASGFRRIQRISKERGQWLLDRTGLIEDSARAGSRRSVWGWARMPMDAKLILPGAQITETMR